MRRKIAMIAVLGGLTAGLGCQHIGGKSDCGYHPSDYPMPAITVPPYPTFPPTVVKTEVIPKLKDGKGSDTDPKKTGMGSGF